jgi:hypothetical protein
VLRDAEGDEGRGAEQRHQQRHRHSGSSAGDADERSGGPTEDELRGAEDRGRAAGGVGVVGQRQCGRVRDHEPDRGDTDEQARENPAQPDPAREDDDEQCGTGRRPGADAGEQHPLRRRP